MTAYLYPTDLQFSLGKDLVQQWRWLSNGTVQHPSPSEQDLTGAHARASVWDPLNFSTVVLSVTDVANGHGSAISFFTPDGGSVLSGIQLLIRSADVALFPFVPPFQDLRLAWGMAVTLASGLVVPFAGGSLWLVP